MSSQHKAPLAAFLVVSVACIVVVVNALRSDAVSDFLGRHSQAVVAGARLFPQPTDILSGEAHLVAGAKTGLTVTPDVVKKVVTGAGYAPEATKPKHGAHHAADIDTAV
ncbi:hypothetical protein ACH5WX_02010, partial [Nocardioides sp. CER28]